MIAMMPVAVAIKQLAVRQPQRQRQHEHDDRGVERGVGAPHDRQRLELRRDGPHFASGLPRRNGLVVDPAAARPAVEQQPDDDDHEQHREHVEISSGIEDDRLFDDSETDGSRRDAREVLHTPEDHGGERADEHGHAQRAPDREIGDTGPQEHGDESKHGGDHPHRRLHASDGDAEGGCPVGPLGRGADRDADTRVAHEQRERDQDDRHDDEDHQVVVVEEHPADAHLDVERWVERGPVEVLEPEPGRHEQRDRRQQLGDADRGNRKDEPRRAREAVDQRPFDDEPEEDRADQAEEERDGVGEPRHPVGRAPLASLASRRIAKIAGTAPRSPCAKLTMRLAR